MMKFSTLAQIVMCFFCVWWDSWVTFGVFRSCPHHICRSWPRGWLSNHVIKLCRRRDHSEHLPILRNGSICVYFACCYSTNLILHMVLIKVSRQTSLMLHVDVCFPGPYARKYQCFCGDFMDKNVPLFFEANMKKSSKVDEHLILV